MSPSLKRGVPKEWFNCIAFIYIYISFRLAVGQLGGHVLRLKAGAARTVVQEIEEEE